MHTTNGAISSADPGPVINRGRLLRLLDQCRGQLQDDLEPLLITTFQRLDDALYDLADKAENDRLYTAYFDALRLVRRERTRLARGFLREIQAQFRRFADIRSTPEQRPASPLFDSDDMTLVDHEDLEVSLVIANLVSKADTHHVRALRELTSHFATLAGYLGLETGQLPCSPQALCMAFGSALRATPDLSLSTALVAYKVFDKQVMERLGPTYSACIGFARALGLTAPPPPARAVSPGPAPRLPRESKPPPSAPAGASAPAAMQAGTIDGMHATPPPVADEHLAGSAISFAQLSLLLAGRPHPLAADAARPALGTDELLNELTRLQHSDLGEADAPLYPAELREALIGALRMVTTGTDPVAGSRRLERPDADTIDLVFLLFEQVLAAPDLPEPIGLLISRLQIPYVKLALRERTFFEEPEHPARRLLNRIAAGAIGWSDDGAREQDPLYTLIRHLVERVITDTHTTPALFTQLNDELDAHLRASGQAAAEAEARTLTGADARAEQQRARRRVMEIIDTRLREHTEVPVVVAAIVYEGFVEALLRLQNDPGEGSPEWRAALQLLDNLLWTVAPRPDPAGRRELLRRIPELLRHLRETLGPVVDNQRLLARWLKELQTLHIAVLRGAIAKPAAEPPPAPLDATDPTAQADVDRLGLGTWVALCRDDDTWLRGKLAWRSSDGQDLLLVDRYGRKVVELTSADLALMLIHDLAQPIGDGRAPLVDRALAAVQQSLRLH